MIFRKRNTKEKKVGGLFERDKSWLFKQLYAMADLVERAIDDALGAIMKKVTILPLRSSERMTM